jgi:hypothetical protein
MKIHTTQPLPNGTVKVTLCMCPGNVTNCLPKDRPVKTFKSKETLNKFEKAFKLTK